MGPALAISRLVAAELYGISPFDPLAYALSAAVLLAAGLAATSLPTRRATQVEPAIALREGQASTLARPSRDR